jgi:hypothetical protein
MRQARNDGYKMEQDFSTSDECKVFDSPKEWCGMQRQMGLNNKRVQRNI